MEVTKSILLILPGMHAFNVPLYQQFLWFNSLHKTNAARFENIMYYIVSKYKIKDFFRDKKNCT